MLSDWMAENAFVSWIESPEPWVVESDLITSVNLPLNLDQNLSSPFLEFIRATRRAAIEIARRSPAVREQARRRLSKAGDQMGGTPGEFLTAVGQIASRRELDNPRSAGAHRLRRGARPDGRQRPTPVRRPNAHATGKKGHANAIGMNCIQSGLSARRAR